MVNVVQNSYSEHLPIARRGMIHGTDYATAAYTCETAAGIPFGVAVSQGAADRGCVLGGTSETFIGVSVRDVVLESANLDKTPQYQGMSVMKEGMIWVLPSHAVAPQDLVYFVPATGVLTNQSGGNEIVLGAVWRSTAESGAPALVEFSGFMHSA